HQRRDSAPLRSRPSTLSSLFFFFLRSRPPPPLHSFPTRRSSDLAFCPAPERIAPLIASSVVTRSAASASSSTTWSFRAFSLSGRDRKSTRLNSSHVSISYAVFCLKKNKNDLCGTRLHRHREREVL